MSAKYDRTSLQTLDGDVQVLCTFDFWPAEKQTLEYPGCDAGVCVTSVAINGHEVDVSVFNPKVISHWENEILREVTDAAIDAKEYAAEMRAEMARDDALLDRVYATKEQA